MTASSMHGDREKCLSAGMNDYISKPINKATLLNTVAKWIDGSKRPVQTPQTGSEKVILDRACIQRLIADTEHSAVIRLLGTFMRETRERLDRIVGAGPKGHYDVIKAEAHAIQGSSATFGAEHLRREAEELELACRQSDQELIRGLAENVCRIGEKTLGAVEDYLATVGQ